MNIYDVIQKYISLGYSEDDAIPKTAQDIVLYKIGNSKYNKNITVKGGVVMHNISKDKRRATRDLDLDFIKYSLGDDSIYNFIKELNHVKDNISIDIIGKIEPLHHQDYDGKRVYIELKDNNNYKISSKLDIGVHKNFDIEQDEYYFSFDVLDKSVSLLINSKEQIIVEKLKSLLKFGITSTRFKDVFDFYYLINKEEISKGKILKYLDILVFQDDKMFENNIEDVVNRMKEIFSNRRFINKINSANNNWLGLPINEVIENVLNYFDSLIGVTA